MQVMVKQSMRIEKVSKNICKQFKHCEIDFCGCWHALLSVMLINRRTIVCSLSDWFIGLSTAMGISWLLVSSGKFFNVNALQAFQLNHF